MRLDSLTRLIEAADFSSFRELASHFLAMRGYSEIAITDGANDGGTDLRVFQLPPNPTPIAFQITVERNWKSKLWEDVEKAKSRLRLDHMTYVTSRRVPEAEFFGETEAIWRDLGVRVTKLDGQAIATTFFLASNTGLVLRLLGIDIGESPIVSQPSARANAAYSVAFFGKDTQHFREATLESAVISAAARHSPADRAKLESDVGTTLGLPADRRAQLSAAIDRMIQKGDLSGPGTALTLSAQLADAASAMAVLRDRDWKQLENSIRDLLSESRIKPTEARIAEIISDLGALLVDVAQEAAGALQTREPMFSSAAKQRLRHLHATLDAMGLAGGTQRDQFLEQLARSASESPVGKCLMAGELFLSLARAGTPQLIRALGGRTQIVTLLDASVAIPMLGGLLFRPVQGRFSLAAQHAYGQLQSHGLPIALPLDYLEEASAHLLRAYHDYGEIVDLDRDLTNSENAFVSHYANQRAEGDATTFPEFLGAFGFSPDLREVDFSIALDALKPRLRRLFDHYSVRTMPLGTQSRQAERQGQEAIAYAMNELRVERPAILARHDARTLGYLFDSDRTTEAAHVLCTWDGVHFKARQRETTASWLALNPAVYGDILSMASDEPTSIASPVVLAKALSEEAADRGARVWDLIARIERGNMRDAGLLDVAQRFKNEYVQNAQGGTQAEAIRLAWATWKAKHYTKSETKKATPGAAASN
jgi:hypothetical protein